MKRFNIVIGGYYESILAMYTVEAETIQEAYDIAEQRYLRELDVYAVNDEEAAEIAKDIWDEENEFWKGEENND